MARAFSPKIVTANALLAGDVIYLSASNDWVRNHASAELILDPAHAQARLQFAAAQGDIVGAYLADAKMAAGGPQPVHFRETFRATGPSNRHHGKQEAGHV